MVSNWSQKGGDISAKTTVNKNLVARSLLSVKSPQTSFFIFFGRSLALRGVGRSSRVSKFFTSRQPLLLMQITQYEVPCSDLKRLEIFGYDFTGFERLGTVWVISGTVQERTLYSVLILAPSHATSGYTCFK